MIIISFMMDTMMRMIDMMTIVINKHLTMYLEFTKSLIHLLLFNYNNKSAKI